MVCAGCGRDRRGVSGGDGDGRPILGTFVAKRTRVRTVPKSGAVRGRPFGYTVERTIPKPPDSSVTTTDCTSIGRPSYVCASSTALIAADEGGRRGGKTVSMLGHQGRRCAPGHTEHNADNVELVLGGGRVAHRRLGGRAQEEPRARLVPGCLQRIRRRRQPRPEFGCMTMKRASGIAMVGNVCCGGSGPDQRV